MRTISHLLVILVLVLWAAACSDEATDTPSDTGSTDTGSSTDTDEDATVEVFEDSTYRLTAVTIIRPAGVGPILEGLINTDIDDGRLHVLIQMTGFAGPWPTSFTITGNAGQSVEGGYTWYDGVEIDTAAAEIDADGFFNGTETLSIIFPALEPNAEEPIQIPVSDLQLEGELFEAEDGWLLDGVLSGAILAENITEISVDLGTPRLLSDLLGGEEAMDYPEGAEGEARTGWRLEAEISADPITFVPAE